MSEFLSGFNFLDFEVGIGGALRIKVGEAAKLAGVKPVDIIRQALETRFGSLRLDEVRARTTINDGNNGFHVLTVVTDGYGNIIAEDTYGKEKATVEWAEDEADPSSLKVYAEVIRRMMVNSAHAEALELLAQTDAYHNAF